MKKIHWFTMSSRSSDIHFLLKYHPKYYYKIYFSSSNFQKPKILAKFKSIKILRSLENPDYVTEDRDLVLSAFKSQRHCLEQLDLKDLALIDYFPKITTFYLCLKIYTSWRIFLKLRNLKSLTIECPYVRDIKNSPFAKRTGRIRDFYQRFWRHFAGLQNLKDFHLHISHKLDPEILNFLVKLNSLEESLSSLENFSLFLSHIDLLDSDEIVNLDLESLYKYLTCFKIHESSFLTMQTFLQHLDQFERLEHLNILKNIHHPGDQSLAVDFTYLTKFQQVTHIKSLDILISFGSGLNFLNFLEHFTIPQSIISLKLSFYEADWACLLSNSQLHNLKFQNTFEFHLLCLSFYDKWENLSHLESLSLCFCEKSSSDTPSLYFVTPIFKKLVTLKSLYFANWVHNFSEPSNIPQKLKALNFYYLWEALQHLKPSLQKLYVDSSAISLRRFPSHYTLNEEEKLALREFGLCGLVVGDVYLEALSKALEKKPSENQENSPSKMEVESLIIDNKESLVKVMEVLAGISKRVQVSITLDLRNVNSEDFMEIMTKSLERMMGKSQVRVEFSKVPGLSLADLRAFKKLFKEYQASISLVQENELREIFPNVEEEAFEDSNEMLSGESDESAEGGSGGDFEEDSSEISDEEDEMFGDELEEIDEDI